MLFTFSLVVYSDVIRFSPPLLYFLYVSFFSSPINTTGRVLPISTCCCLSAYQNLNVFSAAERSDIAEKSIYHAQQHPNVLNCACFVHQIVKKRICYSFKFVSFHQSLKNELRMLHIHLASFLSSWHHCLKNETNYYTIIPLVLSHHGLKNGIYRYYIHSLLKIWAT